MLTRYFFSITNKTPEPHTQGVKYLDVYFDDAIKLQFKHY